MKKILTASLAIFFCFILNAQKIDVWGYGGANLAIFHQNNNDNYRFGIGPDAGILVKAKYKDGYWGWETGAGFIQKGSKFSKDAPHFRALINYAYVHGGLFLYFPLRNDDDIVTTMGVYGGYALSGNYTSDTANNPISFGNQWKKPDAGFYFKGTYDIKNTVSLGYRLDGSFTNTYKPEDPRFSPARNISASVFIALNLTRIF